MMAHIEKEFWKKVTDWENFYEVSNLGILRRIPFNGFTKNGNKHHFRGGIIKYDTKGKYDYVILKQGDRSERFMVGSLIFKTFKGELFKTFKYLDGNVKNNSIHNLIPIPHGYSLCNNCCSILDNSYFYKDNCTYCKTCCIAKSRGYAEEKPEALKEYRKKYTQDNKEILWENRKIYRDNNREYFQKYHRNYNVERRKIDTLFRVKHNVRNRLWCAFKNNNWKKEGSEKLLGASYEIVVTYLEDLFLENMSWENYGRCVDGDCNNYWHIDHKIPLYTATSKEDMELLCHYTNLRPMWAIDNLSRPKH